MDTRVVLVVGATGVIGRNFIEHAEGRGGWTLRGVARRPPPDRAGVGYLPVDLLDPEAARRGLAGQTDVDAIVYAGYVHGSGWQSETEANAALLANAVRAVQAAGAPLRRVVLLQGMKYYGSHLGPFRTPAKEADPRHLPPNFYYDQQDFLEAESRGRGWDWVCLRPHVVCAPNFGSPLNLVSVLGLYAAICRELGLPLKFPGHPAAFRSVTQATDAALLAEAIRWAIETPGCANQAYNVTNGDFFRWENVWPRIAEVFRMPAGSVQTIDMAAFLADKAETWDRIVSARGLSPTKLGEIVDWAFGDYVFRLDWDVMASTAKARRDGFQASLDTEDMFVALLRRMQAERLLPAYPEDRT